MSNILITAGGTSEPIDNIRSITNSGTGRLGSLIADTFALKPSIERIFYICAPDSVRPQSKKVTVIEIKTVADLQTAVDKVFNEYQIDAVIHSMAVSDYAVDAVSTVQDVAYYLRSRHFDLSNLKTDILQAIAYMDVRDGIGKLSSQMQSPLILLRQTPKILPLFRQKAPDTVVVGFKLLSEISKEVLIDTAFQLLQKDECNFVLANDASQISGDSHTGYLIDRQKNILEFHTKQDIAEGIVSAVSKEITQL